MWKFKKEIEGKNGEYYNNTLKNFLEIIKVDEKDFVTFLSNYDLFKKILDIKESFGYTYDCLQADEPTGVYYDKQDLTNHVTIIESQLDYFEKLVKESNNQYIIEREEEWLNKVVLGNQSNKFGLKLNEFFSGIKLKKYISDGLNRKFDDIVIEFTAHTIGELDFVVRKVYN